MKRRRHFLATLTVLATATLFQAVPSGCPQFLTQYALSAFNFCSVLNCEGSTFFDLCDPLATLIDCPGVLAP